MCACVRVCVRVCARTCVTPVLQVKNTLAFFTVLLLSLHLRETSTPSKFQILEVNWVREEKEKEKGEVGKGGGEDGTEKEEEVGKGEGGKEE